MTISTWPSENVWIVWLIGFVLGAVVSASVWIALRSTFDQTLFTRTNYRGRSVPVGAGIILFFSVVVVTAGWWFLDSVLGNLDVGIAGRDAAVMLAGGFGLLGLFDDLAAAGDDRGFRGHLLALAKGRLTTGGVKLIGGGLFALVMVPLGSNGLVWWRLLLGAAVIALAANTANLFDRAPLRCTKVAVVCALPLFAACSHLDQPDLVGVAILVGAALGLAVFEGREELMLGDAGSNVLGAALGYGLVATTDWIPQLATLVVLVALNLASEKVSFSKIIREHAVLRRVDDWGRRSADHA